MRGVVGIDLGTTHTVVASADPPARRAPSIFPVPQLVAEGEVEARALYASSLYAPLEVERARIVDVCGDAPYVTGELAKRRGTEVPGRVVASAKSWLCHPGVDRFAPILPWGAEDESLPRLSPVDASARLLAHLRRAWDEANPERPLFDQDVILTVPASFDETARELTVRAAELAGLEVRLLEEPLAAFYDFLSRTPESTLLDLAARAGGEAYVLVVDVGGGTTDLSLLAVRNDDGRLDVERVAVGRHLLLGGDNMDLALAHACEARLLESGARLDAGRFVQLTSACRAAKEHLLSNDRPPSVPIALAGSGSKLVGATLRTELAGGEVERIVLDGFFPFVASDAKPARAKSALVAFGLPYERDVAVTRHVAEFVARHVPQRREERKVDALLLNGGVFNAARVRTRIAELFESWGGVAPTVLPHADPDLAVARGAVAYGLALRGLALRIAAGAPRAYYIGIATGNAKERRAMCVVPRGALEDVVMRAQDDSAPLALVVGKPVRFDLYMSDDAPPEKPGTIVDLAASNAEYERVPPLAVSLPKDKAASDDVVQVALESRLTSVGTLELACVERGGSNRRFRLAFQLRFEEGEGGSSPPPSVSRVPRSLAPRSLPAQPTQAGSLAPVSVGSRREAEAKDAIDRAFGKPKPDTPQRGGREAKDLIREIERVLGERATWHMELARSLFDALAPLARARRRSADHERVFWMLAGYCLRPGFGAAGDAERMAVIAPLFGERLAFPDEARSWSAFFVAWRRLAGGLGEEDQIKIRDFVDPFLAPPEAALKKPKKPKLEGDFDMLELAASLERAGASRRAALGAWLIERTYTERDPRLWAALGRLGARVPSYASAHHVVAPHTVERWIEHLLREKWETIPTAAQAAASMARMTGDRARDVEGRVRAEVASRLDKVAPDAARWVREVVSLSEADQVAFFGEDLPPGLLLVKTRVDAENT